MLILDYPEWSQHSIVSVLVPEVAYALTPELKRVDEILQDEAFEAPIIERFDTQLGRPTVPVRVYIRLIFLKSYLGLSYEDLVPEVTHNLMYRNFCRIPIEQKVPDETALMKITTRYGEDIVNEINRKLLGYLIKHKLVKGRKLRVDTTVVEANIAHPTDAGLLYEGVKVLEKAATRIKKLFNKNARGSKKNTRKMKEKLQSIGKAFRRRTNDAVKEVRQITGEMAEIAKEAVKQAEDLVRKLVPESVKDIGLVGDLIDTAGKLRKAIRQSEEVNAGNTNLKDRLVSIHDPDARPIVKGKPGKPVEFGYKVQLSECEGGIITGYQVYKGNPGDTTLMDDALNEYIEIFKKPPREMALDRGYYDSKNEKSAYGAGVKHICIPKSGRKSKTRTEFENSRTFKRLKRWRAGIEGRISCLKRRFGLRRSMMRGHRRTVMWTGFGVFANNLRQAARLMVI